jgi:ADP-ribosylglycohydrolase
MISKQDKFKGCMVGLCIGNALGKKSVSNDNQMTIAIANALLKGGETIESFMDALSKEFIEWYKLQEFPEHRCTPDHTCLAACNNLLRGMKWEESGIENSNGCGSTMRSAPIGLYCNKIEKVVDYAINSSRITHGHELALCSAVATALVTHLAINDEPVGGWANEILHVISFNDEFKEIVKLAAEKAAMRTDPDYVLSSACLGEGWTGHDAIASALYCCMMFPNSYEQAVLLAANTVGDSDSIACITGAWMGAKLGMSGIRSDWVEKIENRDLLIKLADDLYKKSS